MGWGRDKRVLFSTFGMCIVQCGLLYVNFECIFKFFKISCNINCNFLCVYCVFVLLLCEFGVYCEFGVL